MKKLIFLAAIMAANISHAQRPDYLTLWDMYVTECDSVMQDTLEETGVVTYTISAKEGDLKLIPKDTVWAEIPCPEYKNYRYKGVLFGGVSSQPAWTGFNYDGSLASGKITAYSKPTFETEITRTKVCDCKMQDPDRDDFWDWLKKKGYRK